MIKDGRMKVVAPSRWLAEEARRSALFGRFSISVIPYGLDVDEFAPRDRREAREVVGIPQDAAVILFVADWPAVHRKGISVLVDAVNELRYWPNLLLVSVGHDVPVLDGALACAHRHLGRVDNDHFLSMIYSAADVFAIPSRQDNLPNTVLEAMACGTPVVGFEVGGITDMVRPGMTGLLAPAHDPAAFGEALAQILRDDEKRAEMSATCRRVAVEEYSLSIQAQRYIDLYRRVCSER
jgi:glycosyltransferase involved in cell wall biosynthesis